MDHERDDDLDLARPPQVQRQQQAPDGPHGYGQPPSHEARMLPPAETVRDLSRQVIELSRRVAQMESDHNAGGYWSRAVNHLTSVNEARLQDLRSQGGQLLVHTNTLREHEARIRDIHTWAVARDVRGQAPSSGPQGIQQPRVRLPEFSAAPAEDWISFREEYEDAVGILGFADEMARRMLKTCIKGEARKVVRDIDFNSCGELSRLLDSYETRFIMPLNSAYARTQYSRAVQKKGESVQMWHNRIRDLFRRAYPECKDSWHVDKSLIHKFIEGLRSSTMRISMFRQQDTNFHTALLTAQKELGAMELAVPSTRSGAPLGEPMEIDALGSGRNNVTQRSRNWSQSRGGGNKSTDCHLCGRPGHYAKECPKLRYAGKLLQQAGVPLPVTYQGPSRRPPARGSGRATRGTRRPFRRPAGGRGRGRIDDLVAELGELIGAVNLSDSESDQEEYYEPGGEHQDDGYEEPQPIVEEPLTSGSTASGPSAAQPGPSRTVPPERSEIYKAFSSWADECEEELFS